MTTPNIPKTQIKAKPANRKKALTEKFPGYSAKVDDTKLPQGWLVKGSRNVLTNESEKVMMRKGYTKYLTSSFAPQIFCVGSYDFEATDASGDIERHIRVMQLGGTLNLELIYKGQAYSIGAFIGSGTEFSFSTFYDINKDLGGNIKNYLLIATGSNGLYFSWSGSLATVRGTSITGSFVTKIQADRNLLSAGFPNSGSVIISGTSYTYSGLTTTIITNDSFVVTGTTTIIPVVGTLFFADFANPVVPIGIPMVSGEFYALKKIATSRNQVYVAHDNVVFISKSDSPNDFTYSGTPTNGVQGVSGRLDGEGGLLTFAEPVTALYSNENIMFVSTKNKWYQIDFMDKPATVTNAGDTATLYYQDLQATPIKTQARQGVANQQLITSIYNNIVFVSNEPTITTLGAVIQQDKTLSSMLSNLALQSISETIKNDVTKYDYTNGSLIYHQTYLYIAVPKSELFLMYDTIRQTWEAPQYIPISCFNIIDGELYGNSYLNADMYKLFDGNNDNGQPINSVARFAWMDSGHRDIYKHFNEWFTDGRINTETKLNLDINYDGKVHKQIIIDGSDKNIAPDTNNYNYLGSNFLGEEPFGTSEDNNSNVNRFHIKPTMAHLDYFEIQPTYYSNTLHQYWEILSIGSNSTESGNDTSIIKR